MQTVITVGKGPEKLSLENAISIANEAKEKTIINIDPGEYFFEDGFELKKCKLKICGKGNSSKDVIIHTFFNVISYSDLELENLNLINQVESNAVYGFRSKINANKVIFSNIDVCKPTIFMKLSKGNFTECRFNNENIEYYSLASSYKSDVSISKCYVQGCFCENSKIKSESSEFQKYLNVSEKSEFNADNLYFNYQDKDYCLINVLGNSTLKTNKLIVPERTNFAKVKNSIFEYQKSNINGPIKLKVTVQGKSEINVPNAEIKKPRLLKKKPHGSLNVPQEKIKKSAYDQLSEAIGLKDLKQKVDDFIKIGKFNKKRKQLGVEPVKQTFNSFFLGNSGTRKLDLARLLAKIMYQNKLLRKDSIKVVKWNDLMSANVDHTTDVILSEALGGILFIDDISSIDQQLDREDKIQEAIYTIINFPHHDDILIILAGYPKEMKKLMNDYQEINTCIPNVFNFKDITTEETAEIGIVNLKGRNYQFDEKYYKEKMLKKIKSNFNKTNVKLINSYNDKIIQKFSISFSNFASNDVLKIPNSIIDEVIVENQHSRDVEVDKLLKELNGMIGLHNVKTFVNDLVKTIRFERKFQDKLPKSENPTYHMVFSGSPGTGKTTVARVIAKLFYNLGILPKDTVSEVYRTDLIGEYIGHTEKKTSTAIKNAMGGVLFVDEAYQLSSDSSDRDFGKQAIETFITELENNRDKFVAIFAGYTKEMDKFLEANAGLRSRIPLTIEFEDYTPEEIAQIVLSIITKDWKVDEELLKKVVTNTYRQLPDSEKGNGRWARNFAEKLVAKHKRWLADNYIEGMDFNYINNDLLTDMNKLSKLRFLSNITDDKDI